LVGIRNVVLAINKMDLVEYSAERFQAIHREYEAFAAPLGFTEIAAIPISALNGDNVIEKSSNTGWYEGPTLMTYLEKVQVDDEAASKPFRLPVQWVNRPHLDFRGFCGTIASGTIRPGDELLVASSGKKSRVARIVTMDGDLQEAVAGQAVTLTLEDEIDVSRGDLLVPPQALPAQARYLEAHLVWLHEETLETGRSYLFKAGASVIPARISAVAHKVNVNTLEQQQGESLGLNEIGACRLELDRAVAFDAYRKNRGTGSFILIDRLSNATVAAGMFVAPLPDEEREQRTTILERQEKGRSHDEQPAIIWIDGPVGSEPLTAAREAATELRNKGERTFLLDAGELRNGLNRDLGEDAEAEAEAARRMAEVAGLLADAGLTVLVAAHQQISGNMEEVRSILSSHVLQEIRLTAGNGRRAA
ncbi:MAG TPA: adenylyl-sulfate kinase, partial [Desulfurivibrionaceae bacterium]|nr:adenylyl-sulfate kinase [Desulfurivibrionaceae bacterium]